MAKTKALLALVALGFAVAVQAAGQSEAERARQLLLKTLERSYPQNVIAIIMQRTGEANGSMQRVQVQINRDGKMRQTVIYPLSLEGVETIDDGRQSATFLPDENLVIVQESPKLLPNDAGTRISLTVRNYSLKLGGNATIAGRPATIVVATPRARELETRRYYIDEKTGFLLQLETMESNGRPKIAFQAQTVVYPAKISPQTFMIDLEVGNYQKTIYKRRGNILSMDSRGSSLGFEPVLPDRLPMGFELQDAQINDSGDWRSVAVRITDGPVKGTVYQWPSSEKVGVKATAGTTMDTAGGLKFVVAADIPEAARKRLLNTFLEAARRQAYVPPLLGQTFQLELIGLDETLTRAVALFQIVPVGGGMPRVLSESW